MNESCEIVMVLDRSGSMASRQEETVQGFNDFLDEQKKLPGEARLTLCQFDQEYEILHDGVLLNVVPEMTNATFVPRGTTAMYDAIGRTANTVAERLAALSEADRPGKIVFVVLTDGLENASKEFTSATVSELVERLKAQNGWEFLFIGASAECFKGAQAVSIPKAAAYDGSKPGTTRKVYEQTSAQLCAFRGGGEINHRSITGT